MAYKMIEQLQLLRNRILERTLNEEQNEFLMKMLRRENEKKCVCVCVWVCGCLSWECASVRLRESACVCMGVCVCVCVCVWERERERECEDWCNISMSPFLSQCVLDPLTSETFLSLSCLPNLKLETIFGLSVSRNCFGETKFGFGNLWRQTSYRNKNAKMGLHGCFHVLKFAAGIIKQQWSKCRKGFHQWQMALLVTDVSLLRLSLQKIFFVRQNNLSFNKAKYCHLILCLHLIEMI